MHIYNVTINVEETIHENWLQWMKTKHIPDMLATGKFTKALMTRVLVEEEMGGITYSVQYKAKSRVALDEYYRDHADRLRQDGLKRFADKTVAFRTELEVIDEYAVSFN